MKSYKHPVRLYVLLALTAAAAGWLTLNTLPLWQSPAEQEAVFFTLRASRGGIVVCAQDTEEELFWWDIDPGSLPPFDRARLADGIRVDSLEQLEQLREDLSG